LSVAPRHCAHCGGLLETVWVDQRARARCPDCGRIAYQNPLPVVAALVADERRRVLLVQRALPPQEGLWCLPMGFLELGESVVEGALRELAEETGLQGAEPELLDVSSQHSEHYGDLIVVTYRIGATAGVPRAGDDAAALGWWDLDALPPLAFDSTLRALQRWRARPLPGGGASAPPGPAPPEES